MSKEIIGDKGMDKEKCGHFGEYGFADGYYGRKYCRFDGCPDSIECSNKMKEVIAEHDGDYLLAMISNREKGQRAKEDEGKARVQAQKPGPKEIKEEEKAPEVEAKKPEAETKEIPVKEKAKKKYECECIECGYKMKPTVVHCKDIKCAKCGGQMRRVGRPGPGRKSMEEKDES